jgi:hypothetical protein
MTKHDPETTQIMQHAVEDLQMYMATAGKDTTEGMIKAWQIGYIAGVNRAIGMRDEQGTEESY